MSAGLVGLAVALVAGGVVAVSARRAGVAVVALGVVAVLAPLMSGAPLEPLPVGARAVSALLAAYLLWIAVRGEVVTRGSAIGWQAEALVAAACAVAGAAAAGAMSGAVPGGAPGSPGVGPTGGGPGEALMAGAALAALAIGPLLAGRDALRLGVGLLLAVHAAALLRVGLAGAPPAFEHLALGGLVAAIGAAVAALAAAALRANGGLDMDLPRRAAAHRPPGPPGSPGSPRFGGAPGAKGVPGQAGAPVVVPRSSGTRRIPGP